MSKLETDTVSSVLPSKDTTGRTERLVELLVAVTGHVVEHGAFGDSTVDEVNDLAWLADSLPSLLESQRDAKRWRFVAPYLAHRIRARNGKMELVFQEESRWEPKEISLPTNVAGGRTNELIEFAIDRGIAAASPSPEDR